MLHIVLFILKIIGWILLSILILLVLTIFAVLFLPAHYQADVSIKGGLHSLNAEVSFHSFFRMFSAKFRVRQGKTFWNLRIMWKKYHSGGSAGKRKEAKASQNKKVAGRAKKNKQTEVSQNGKAADSAGKAKSAEANQSGKAADTVGKTKAVEAIQSGKATNSTEKTKAPESGKGAKRKKRGMSFFKKIKYTFDRFCDKIKKILAKKIFWQAFLTEETHRKAFSRVFLEVKKFLCRVKPRKAAGSIHFGFADPALTGQVLGGISILYPVCAVPLEIQPDFEQKVLEGELSVAGRIQFFVLAAFLWNILWDKNIRVTYAHYKTSKGE